jgi:hypothetical protein
MDEIYQTMSASQSVIDGIQRSIKEQTSWPVGWTNHANRRARAALIRTMPVLPLAGYFQGMPIKTILMKLSMVYEIFRMR